MGKEKNGAILLSKPNRQINDTNPAWRDTAAPASLGGAGSPFISEAALGH